jgi:hypothetical protein
MNAMINGWNVHVESVAQIVYSQIAINHLRIPDDVILVIKDYLYISEIEVKRKFYKYAINSSMLRMPIMNPRFLSDSLGLPRLVYWACLLTDDWKHDLQLQGFTCVDCGNPADLCNNLNKYCIHDGTGEVMVPKAPEQAELTEWLSNDTKPIALPEDLLTVESTHVSLLNKSNHSGQWSIISNDNQQNKAFEGWDNDGQEFGYDSDWFAESRDV